MVPWQSLDQWGVLERLPRSLGRGSHARWVGALGVAPTPTPLIRGRLPLRTKWCKVAAPALLPRRCQPSAAPRARRACANDGALCRTRFFFCVLEAFTGSFACASLRRAAYVRASGDDGHYSHGSLASARTTLATPLSCFLVIYGYMLLSSQKQGPDSTMTPLCQLSAVSRRWHATAVRTLRPARVCTAF